MEIEQMNLLFGNFDKIIDAPNGIEKAREMVLQLAVQGKLVEQDPNDEPASELLKKIKKEKEKLITKGKIKKQKELPAIKDEEKPFHLPRSWKWVRLGQIGEIFNGNSISSQLKASKYSRVNDGLDYIGTKDVDFYKYQLAYNNGIRIPIDEPKFKIAHKNSVLICAEGGSAGRKIGIAEKDICFGNKLFAIETYVKLPEYFIYSVYKSPYFFELFASKMTGIIGGISLNNFKSLIFPLPPLNEQKRIVEKVNSLMLLLDELEEKRSRREAKRVKLNISALDKLTKSASTKEFKLNWNRVTQNFETLYSVPENVDKLKQTILQLAVQGKLTEQWRKENPDVVPANELLKKIKKEKEKLIAEGKIKKQKELPPIKDEEKPFELPDGWEWVSLDQIGLVNPRNYVDDNLETSFIPMKNISEKFGVKPKFDKRLWKDIKQGFTHFAENDVGLAKITPCFENGKAAIFRNLLNGIGAGTTELYIFRTLIEEIISDYIYIYIKSVSFIERGKTHMTGTAGQKRVKKDYFADTLFGLPNFQEQKQIIKRVNELISLCDKLESKIKLKTAEQERLVESVVKEIAESG